MSNFGYFKKRSQNAIVILLIINVLYCFFSSIFEHVFDANFEHPTLQGDRFAFLITQGAALGYELLPFQGVWNLPAKLEVYI